MPRFPTDKDFYNIFSLLSTQTLPLVSRLTPSFSLWYCNPNQVSEGPRSFRAAEVVAMQIISFHLLTIPTLML